MKELTEADFTLELTELVINTGTEDGNEIKQQILKNQEMAKQVDEAGFVLVPKASFTIMVGIVERLQKEKKQTKDFLDNSPNYEGSGTVEVKKRILPILQEILGEKKNETTD